MAHKVIHVVLGKANPNRSNGVNRVVDHLAHHQQMEGVLVELWGITKDPVHNYPERKYSTRLFQDQKFKFNLDESLVNAIESIDPKQTTVHLHGAYLPQFFSVCKHLVARQIEYVYTPHGAFNQVAMQRSAIKKKIYNYFFESFIVKHAKAVHSIGASEQMGTQATFRKAKQVLIPNGQDIQELAFKPSLQKSIPVFGFLGRLDLRTKGLDLLLQGFSKFVKETGFNVQLWIAGDGPDKKQLIRLSEKLKIDHLVHFKGSIYGDQKMQWLKHLDYLCLTSRNEGLPGVVLEAASVGTPAIISKETNLAQFVQEFQSGIALKKNDPKHIARAMKEAIHHQIGLVYSLQSDQAKAMIAQAFNWKNIAQQHIAVYES